MPHQRMKRPGDGSTDDTNAAQALAEIEVPDVSGQLERLATAAQQAGKDKGAERERKRQERREKKAREERMRCCGIRSI